MTTNVSHIYGRLEYDHRRNKVLFERVPLRHCEVDELTDDERSALIAFKAFPLPTSDTEWRIAI
jgi:hypothetical protein